MTRTYDDSFSGARIYPGKGKLYVRIDNKVFRFQNGKTESLFLQRKNPRRIAWTVQFRRQRRKGATEEAVKKRTRRAIKVQRAVVGASLDVIKEKRTLTSRMAVRKTGLEDNKKTQEAKRKMDKAKVARGSATRGIASKQGSKGAAPKVIAKTR